VDDGEGYADDGEEPDWDRMNVRAEVCPALTLRLLSPADSSLPLSPFLCFSTPPRLVLSSQYQEAV
jgi:hypothetical protein